MQSAYRPIRVALLGAGSVGSQVARLLLENSEELASRVGTTLELSGIAVRNLKAERDFDLPEELLTEDAESLILGSDVRSSLVLMLSPPIRPSLRPMDRNYSDWLTSLAPSFILRPL